MTYLEACHEKVKGMAESLSALINLSLEGGLMSHRAVEKFRNLTTRKSPFLKASLNIACCCVMENRNVNSCSQLQSF